MINADHPLMQPEPKAAQIERLEWARAYYQLRQQLENLLYSQDPLAVVTVAAIREHEAEPDAQFELEYFLEFSLPVFEQVSEQPAEKFSRLQALHQIEQLGKVLEEIAENQRAPIADRLESHKPLLQPIIQTLLEFQQELEKSAPAPKQSRSLIDKFLGLFKRGSRGK